MLLETVRAIIIQMGFAQPTNLLSKLILFSFNKLSEFVFYQQTRKSVLVCSMSSLTEENRFLVQRKLLYSLSTQVKMYFEPPL